MADSRESSLAYFMSITRSQRDDAIAFLEKCHWRLDRSLNLFFECNHKQDRSSVQNYESKSNARTLELLPHSSRPSTRKIIIPAMIEFQKFIQSFDTHAINLLENSSKMMDLAMKYVRCQPSNITLLDNDMCAPLVWIEHFEHLLNGNTCQLFDCDYMFQLAD
ncbi:unnamed protein product [Adineta ricciae]|uniref:Uncharacterized protein n=1 Tax=Adineta ricciae TaxID=249248 RepID=A0A814PMU0_ADIRI|nr:unnamed protein product [Adineta ricciae]